MCQATTPTAGPPTVASVLAGCPLNPLPNWRFLRQLDEPNRLSSSCGRGGAAASRARGRGVVTSAAASGVTERRWRHGLPLRLQGHSTAQQEAGITSRHPARPLTAGVHVSRRSCYSPTAVTVCVALPSVGDATRSVLWRDHWYGRRFANDLLTNVASPPVIRWVRPKTEATSWLR